MPEQSSERQKPKSYPQKTNDFRYRKYIIYTMPELKKKTKSTHIEETLYDEVRSTAYRNEMQLNQFIEKVLSVVIADEKLLKKVLK